MDYLYKYLIHISKYLDHLSKHLILILKIAHMGWEDVTIYFRIA
jgi:hypothetical protein